MKKYMMAGVIIVINSWLLLGCSNDQKSETDAPNQVEVENENIEKSDDFEADIDTFIEEVTKVNQELKSFSIESTIDTTQTFDGEKDHSITTQEQDTIFEPFQYRKYMLTEQQDDSDYDEGELNDEEITIYNVDGINYVNFKGSFGDGKQWVKSENEYTEDDMREVEGVNVKKVLENWSDITVEKTLNEEGDFYILSLIIDLDKLAELDKENPQFSQSEDEEAMQKLKDTYEVKQMDYQMKFDKESKFLLELESTRKFSYEMDFNDKTDTMETEEKTVIIYRDHNQVDEIVLPEEVRENAKEPTE